MIFKRNMINLYSEEITIFEILKKKSILNLLVKNNFKRCKTGKQFNKNIFAGHYEPQILCDLTTCVHEKSGARSDSTNYSRASPFRPPFASRG